MERACMSECVDKTRRINRGTCIPTRCDPSQSGRLSECSRPGADPCSRFHATTFRRVGDSEVGWDERPLSRRRQEEYDEREEEKETSAGMQILRVYHLLTSGQVRPPPCARSGRMGGVQEWRQRLIVGMAWERMEVDKILARWCDAVC